MNKRAVCLLSGGIDSATTLAIAKKDGYQIYALSFRYGQRHIHELKVAVKLAEIFEVEKHLILDVDLGAIGGSSLTDRIEVPKARAESEMAQSIPSTYVPAWITIFLSLALAWAETMQISDIFIGVNALDYSGYPDCRPEYIEAFERMANLATRAGVEGKTMRIHTPLITLTKAEIIQKAVALHVDLETTHSCYDPSADGKACGLCDSCLLRKKGFQEAGIEDPTHYINS